MPVVNGGGSVIIARNKIPVKSETICKLPLSQITNSVYTQHSVSMLIAEGLKEERFVRTDRDGQTKRGMQGRGVEYPIGQDRSSSRQGGSEFSQCPAGWIGPSVQTMGPARAFKVIPHEWCPSGT